LGEATAQVDAHGKSVTTEDGYGLGDSWKFILSENGIFELK